ncbi:ABZJ_00895 family protein [Agarivorans sp. TSD2052]|uniref:ABZJ_00895 family protein n=1 Tax=Agarivorans sp. TSD2052 TaxID=2937286 RepID=UPI00200D7AE3|nr:ABZJ_00895 family protein [Agarivorans sp. TSD2052]UPW18098.1 ABZJ_00895 family protein [Agarivorans sp. TSD2052]
MQAASVSMNKYILWFSVVYLCSSVLFGLVVWHMELASNSCLGILSLMLAALVVVQVFVKDQGRTLSRAEIWLLSIYSWLVSVVISLVTVAAVFIHSFYQIYGLLYWLDIRAEALAWLTELSIDLHALYAIITLVLLLFFGVTRLAYGLANLAFNKRNPLLGANRVADNK